MLLIHLGALGAVVRSTALIAPLRRKFPRAHLTWVTQKPADQLLRSHPGIDRVLTTDSADLLSLRALDFDAAFVIDKSLAASGVLAMTKADLVYGFVADPRTGAIRPATPAAQELWQIGLDDQLKFHRNQKSEIQLVTEALEIGPWKRDEYNLPLTSSEELLRAERHDAWSSQGLRRVVGLNTGCSNVIAAKKWTIETHRALVRRLQEDPAIRVVLLGGPEDSQRNQKIAQGLDLIESPTESGLRDGLVSVAACDLVVTGDSLGMHLAISQKIPVIAWFGPTCEQEIEIYGRGVKIKSGLSCSPCWKRTCSKDVMCYDGIDLQQVEKSLRDLLGLQERPAPCHNPEQPELT
ncbi:MAG: glycosyltransferase family 9 protein [Bdellovibrionaceae bacterium]|nr:glycosyltransferase family 9 protein [Pseudobdellovibrionaceae bacterium]